MGRSGGFLDLVDGCPFERLHHLLIGFLRGCTRNFIGNLPNFIGKVTFCQLVEPGILDLGKLANLGAGQHMSRDDFLHAFLGLSADIAERHIGDLAFQNDIKVASGNTRQFTFIFRLLDQGLFLFRRCAIIDLAICAQNLPLLEGQGRRWRHGQNRRHCNQRHYTDQFHHWSLPKIWREYIDQTATINRKRWYQIPATAYSTLTAICE